MFIASQCSPKPNSKFHHKPLASSKEEPKQPPNSYCTSTISQNTVTSLLDSDRLGQVTREINVETLKNGKPVGNELERDNVEETLENVDRLGDLDLLGFRRLELLIRGVADNDGLTTASNNLLIGVE